LPIGAGSAPNAFADSCRQIFVSLILSVLLCRDVIEAFRTLRADSCSISLCRILCFLSLLFSLWHSDCGEFFRVTDAQQQATGTSLRPMAVPLPGQLVESLVYTRNWKASGPPIQNKCNLGGLGP